jgi:GDP-mannose 6-dehydrogenase
MRVSIFGLGYVGAVSLGCLARDGHAVTGVDLDPAKLDLIRNGMTPVIEAGMQELMKNAAEKHGVQVTADAAEAVLGTEVSLICVGTPSLRNGGQDLSAVERLVKQLGEAIRDKTEHHVFVVRSTVFPGTTEELVTTGLEKHSGKRAGSGFDVCFQPEFLREGTSIKDYDNPPFTIVGTESPRVKEVMQELYGHLPAEMVWTSVRTAEMMKYACNIFHAMKITFANEIGRLSQGLGVNPHEVMDIVCRDRSLNISPAYLKPGFAFGGSCLPKDLRAMLYMAKEHDVSVPMLAGILPSNRLHVEQAVEKVLASGHRKIGMIGLSFKTGTDDLRESPLVTMVEQFIGKGLQLEIYDPEVNLSRLVGGNRRYIEESIPHIASLMTQNLDNLVDAADVVVVGLHDDAALSSLRDRGRDDQLIVDLVNVPSSESLKGEYWGACW